MIHPTRTNLLLLKEKARSVTGSVGILTARRLALIREILAISTPFLLSRAEVKKAYARALTEMALTNGMEGDDFIGSLPMEAFTRRGCGSGGTERHGASEHFHRATRTTRPQAGSQEGTG